MADRRKTKGFLSRAIDVSYYGSRMTVINGQNGAIVVDAAKNTSNVYLSWTLFPSTEVYDLNLPQSLLTIKSALESGVDRVRYSARFTSYSHVALVIGYSSTISDDDHNEAKKIVSSIKALNPGVKVGLSGGDVCQE